MPTVCLLHAPGDRSFPTDRLQKKLGNGYTVQSAADLTPAELDRGPWYLLLLNPTSVGSQTLANQATHLLDRWPDRVVPVVLEDCSFQELHPKLEFADYIDLRSDTPETWRRLVEVLQDKPVGKLRPLKQIVLFMSLKGGVAKTTNTVALAEALADKGRRVLVIDTDHQCASSTLLLGEDEVIRREEKKRTLEELFAQMLKEPFDYDDVAHYIVPAQTSIARVNHNLSVLPSSLLIEEFALREDVRKGPRTLTETVIHLQRTRAPGLANWLKERYDFVLIDCPPSLSWQVLVFLAGADGYLMPCIPDRLSVRGAKYLVDRLGRMKTKLPPFGLLWSLVNGRNPSHGWTIKAAVERDGDLYKALPMPFVNTVPMTAQIREAQETPVDPSEAPTTFKKKYKVLASIYHELAGELIRRLNQAGQGAVRPAKAHA
jgi:chromosome partitioning protein